MYVFNSNYTKMSYWVKQGKIYGYPECCIDSFVTRMTDVMTDVDNINLHSRTQIYVSNRTGFIPCSYCSWKVLSKQCKLEDLIKNRKINKPFPQDYTDTKDYVITSKKYKNDNLLY